MRDRHPARLSDGFLVTAWDLHRAVRIARLDPAELFLFFEAHECSWAPGLIEGDREPRPFRLRFAALARISGFHRGTLWRTHRRLESARIFTPAGPKQPKHFHINKDYRLWLARDGGPRFTTEQLAWVAEGGPKSYAGNGVAGQRPPAAPITVKRDRWSSYTERAKELEHESEGTK